MGYRRIILFFVFIFCFATVKVFAQTPSCSVASKFYSKDSINITTFGASTVHGIGGFSFQPYLKQNFEYCYPGKVVTVSNYGISAQTTSEGLARFADAVAGKTGFVCILMGVNDALNLVTPTMATAQQANKAIAAAQTNIEAMIKISLENDLVPIIGTVQYIIPNGNKALITANAYIKRINAGYIKLVGKYKGKAYLADINAALGYDAKLFQADGIHPNDKGYKVLSYVWFDAINEAIENKLLLIGLDQNFPNPASTKSTIGFSLSQSANVNIQMYSILGVPVKTVTNEFYNSGYHQIEILLGDLKPGIYIYVMHIAGRELTKKMIVVR
ncbi:MAG: GDSL-type esterase/lipase family protein [Mucilaginibacter sp.]|uniref:GDSL-type esterase/lipase family protein n=1 Tax=Mucilaginibacter sp. TaxID=1882438 RepID=UPI0032674B02